MRPAGSSTSVELDARTSAFHDARGRSGGSSPGHRLATLRVQCIGVFARRTISALVMLHRRHPCRFEHSPLRALSSRLTVCPEPRPLRLRLREKTQATTTRGAFFGTAPTSRRALSRTLFDQTPDSLSPLACALTSARHAERFLEFHGFAHHGDRGVSRPFTSTLLAQALAIFGRCTLRFDRTDETSFLDLAIQESERRRSRDCDYRFLQLGVRRTSQYPNSSPASSSRARS